MYTETVETNQSNKTAVQTKDEKTFGDKALDVASQLATVAVGAFVTGVFMSLGQSAYGSFASRNKSNGDVIPLKIV